MSKVRSLGIVALMPGVAALKIVACKCVQLNKQDMLNPSVCVKGAVVKGSIYWCSTNVQL